jgi:hypothetical protein
VTRPPFQVPSDTRLADPDADRAHRETVSALRSVANHPLVRSIELRVTFASPATDTEVVHGLPALTGYLVLRASAPLSVYDGGADPRPGVSLLRSSAAGTVTLRVF